jgi:hypothetical protein
MPGNENGLHTGTNQIKNALRDEIAEGLISARDIERYYPGKWKKSTKPKAGANTENDRLSIH